MIRCLDGVRRTLRRKVRHTMHSPAAGLLVVWAPCAVAAAGGLWISHRWGTLIEAVDTAKLGAVAIPAPSLFLVWIAAGVCIAAWRKA